MSNIEIYNEIQNNPKEYPCWDMLYNDHLLYILCTRKNEEALVSKITHLTDKNFIIGSIPASRDTVALSAIVFHQSRNPKEYNKLREVKKKALFDIGILAKDIVLGLNRAKKINNIIKSLDETLNQHNKLKDAAIELGKAKPEKNLNHSLIGCKIKDELKKPGIDNKKVRILVNMLDMLDKLIEHDTQIK